MHTVELLLDAGTEAGVRAVWERLRAAGLPSLATHPHPTNRPHLTVLTAESLDGLPPLVLPSDVELGAVRMLGRALVREVTPSAGLVALHRAVHDAVGGWPPPGQWVPHVSLALRFAGPVPALGLAPVRARVVAARSYDSRSRTVTALPAGRRAAPR